MIKIFRNQIIIFTIVLLYSFLFIPISYHASDRLVWVYLSIPPLLIGVVTGLICGISSITFGLYYIVIAVILGITDVYPYYSKDVGWIPPVVIYSVIVVVTNILGIFLFLMLLKRLKRYNNRPNESR